VRHLRCAMTHIDPRMKEDSLLFLDVLVQNCNSALAKHSHKILSNFLGMIINNNVTFQNIYLYFLLATRNFVQVHISILRKKPYLDNLLMPLMSDIWLEEQNLGLCQIHIWLTFNSNEQFPKSVRSYCISILKNYMPFLRNSFSGIIENWCDSSTLPQLTKLLKTLFLKAEPVWYNNCINLNHTLRLIIEASSRLPKTELQVGDIMLNSNLNELHR
ncbi:hypothetical protein ALC57_15134, partial [Trachymyrmex cornetzi]